MSFKQLFITHQKKTDGSWEEGVFLFQEEDFCTMQLLLSIMGTKISLSRKIGVFIQF